MTEETPLARLFAFLDAEYEGADTARLCADLAAALVRAVKAVPEDEQCGHVEQVILGFLLPLGYRRGGPEPEDAAQVFAPVRH